MPLTNTLRHISTAVPLFAPFLDLSNNCGPVRTNNMKRKAFGNSSQNPKRHHASTTPSPSDVITSTDDRPCHPRPHRPPGPPSPLPTQDITPDEALARSFELQYSIERHNYIAEHNAHAEREITENLDLRDAMNFAGREDERQQEPSRAHWRGG